MKTNFSRVILALLLTLLFISVPSTAHAQSPDGDKLVFGGSFILQSGEILNGDLVVFGGTAIISEDSVIGGSVALAGGTLDVEGEIRGSITAFGGTINLGDNAVVRGDVNTMGVAVIRGEGAEIQGNISHQLPGSIDLPFNIPFFPQIPGTPYSPRFQFDFSPIREIFWMFFRTLAISALAVLITLFLEKPVMRIGKSITNQPVIAGSLGLLTAVVAPGILVVLTITILLIPVSLLGIIILGIALLFGWIAVGLEIGDRLAKLLNQEWEPPISAGLGTLLLTLVANGINWIPCIGWMAGTLIAILGLGGVLLSGFGSREYPHPRQTRIDRQADSQDEEIKP